MRKSIFLGYVLLAIFLSACADAKKPAAGKNAITALEFSRGACFGKCPIYTIKIYNTGLVRYTGIKFVEFEGTYEKKFDKAKIKKLLDEATEYRIDTCKAEYPYVPDLAGVDYVVTYKNRTQKIHNGNRGPAFLLELSADIDGAVKVDKTWKKVPKKTTEARNP